MHYSCLLGDFLKSQRWCATTENYDRDQQWKLCQKEERPTGYCDPNPCQNGGACEARKAGFHCTCTGGFHGRRCEKEGCFGSQRWLHVGKKETWLQYFPSGLKECHCNRKKILCKTIHGKACRSNPCLNGGQCIQLGQNLVCSCPEKFSGPLCDIDHTEICYSGNGHLYRGMAQSSSSGAACLPWDSPILLMEYSIKLGNAVSLGLGEHAFCRNPDNDTQPWCFLLQDRRITWEYCNITRCHPQSAALVQLEEKSPGYCIGFSNSISPICLPGALETDDNNGHCQIAGWGHMYEGADKFSVYLQEADVPIIPHEQCHSPEVHGSQITQGMLCAGYLEGRIDACQGDSGGPLVCEEQGKATIRGIVSWSTGCAQRSKPGVYTNVARYLSWIQSNMH